LCFCSQDRLADAAKLAGQDGIHRVSDLRLRSRLFQLGRRDGGQASYDPEGRALDSCLNLGRFVHAREFNGDPELEFEIRDLRLKESFVAITVDFLELINSINKLDE